MKAWKSICLIFVGLALSVSALAVVPEQGLWWNPSESGRGYGIEVQDDLVFVTYYAYDESGSASAFYTSIGHLNVNTGIVNADFLTFSNGQCFGCAYRNPTPLSLGEARFRFTSQRSGTVTLPGNIVIPIERQLFMGNNPQVALLGTWHLTYGALGLYFGNSLYFDRAYNDSSLKNAFAGGVIDGASSRVALGAQMEDDEDLIMVLVDASSTHYKAYLFEWAANKWVGRSWTYKKSEQLSGNGLPMFGARILGKKLSGLSANATAPKNAVRADMTLDMLELAAYATEMAGDTKMNSVAGNVSPRLQSVDSNLIARHASRLQEEMERVID